MENTAIRRGKVEMSVVCSDLSLLENINSLLNDNGFISVEDEQGIMHYIVDGRHNRDEVAGRVTSLSPGRKNKQGKEEAYIDTCVKSVLHEYGFDMSLIGTVLLYRVLSTRLTQSQLTARPSRSTKSLTLTIALGVSSV